MAGKQWSTLQKTGVILACMVCVGLAIFVVIRNGIGGGRKSVKVLVPPQFFFDLQAGQLYVATTDQKPPLSAPSGGEGVEAAVFACGTCPAGIASMDPAARQNAKVIIGWLGKYTDEGRRAIEQQAGSNVEDPQERKQLVNAAQAGYLVSGDEGKTWQSIAQPSGQAIMQRTAKPCPDGTPAARCLP